MTEDIKIPKGVYTYSAKYVLPNGTTQYIFGWRKANKESTYEDMYRTIADAVGDKCKGSIAITSLVRLGSTIEDKLWCAIAAISCALVAATLTYLYVTYTLC